MTVQVPTITSFTPDTGGPTTTDSNVITLIGSAAPSTTVQVFNNNILLGTAAVDASGAWSFTTPALGTGFFFVSLTAVDVSGGVSSAPSAALNLVIDATTPPTPVITGFSPDTGTVGDGVTTAQVVTLTGTLGRLDGYLHIYDGATYLGDAAVNSNNSTWTFQTGTLAAGSVHDFTAVFVAFSGATSAASADLHVSIIAPPAVPSIVAISPDTGVVGDGLTNATVLTLTGNATANMTVDVYDGATLLGNTTANASGVWTFTTGQLANGTHSFTATTVDNLGNPSAPSAAVSMTIDAHTPAAPVILTEAVGSGGVVTISGTAEANDTVRIYDNNGLTLLGSATANAAGAWSYIAGTLAPGTHAISATATDPAGTTSLFSPDPVLTIGSGPSGTAPNAPVILSASPDSGPPNNLVSTSNQLTLTGDAAANTLITLFDGTTQLGSALTNAQGVWSFTTASLADGAHIFAATATDSSGDVSAQSSSLSVTVQPNIAAFSPITDQWQNPISVDGLPFFVQNANVNGNAPWSINQTDPQTFRFELRPGDYWSDNGSHRTEVAQASLDAAGTPINLSYQFMVEPGATGNSWTVLGQFHSNDGGILPSGADFPVFAFEMTGQGGVGHGDYLGVWAAYALPGQTDPTQITNGSLPWLYVTPTPITRGQYNSVQIEANFQDNSSGFLEVWLNGSQIVDYHGPIGYYGQSVYWKEGIYQDLSNFTQTLAVDYKNLQLSTAPSAPLILTDTATGAYALLSGSAQANSTVTVYDGATKLGTAAVSRGGVWSFETSALSLGTHALTATATDVAGNVSAASNVSNATITSLTTPAVTKVISSAGAGEVTVGGTITLTLDMSTAVTVNGVPTLALSNGGTATYIGGSGTNALTFKYTVGASDGTVSSLAINGVNLPGGATIKDGSGNAASLVGAAVPIAGIVDTSVVQTPVFTTSTVNNNGTFTLNGTAGANTTVTINDGTAVVGTAAADSAGNWTFTTPTFPNNTFLGYTAIDTNSLGDVSAVGNGPGFGINTTLPPSPLISGDALNGNAVTLYGSITPGFSITAVKVLDGATVLGTTTVNSDGSWSFTTGQLANGVHSFTSESVNASGTSAVSEPIKLTVGAAAVGIAPAVLSVVETPSSGDLNAGKTVTLTLNLSSAVTVAGGVPTLTLNDGGTATYTGGSGSNALTFSYTVGAGQNAASLAATAVNLNGATAQDGSGNAANLLLTGLTQTGPQIDTTTPTVSSVVASGTGITAGSGDLGVGSVVTLTLNLNEAVTVAGGVPTLTLNDGGTASYTGGSGTNALTFSYTVGAGQNTADLTVTAFNAGTATIKNGAGTAANLSGAVTNPAGILQIDTTTSTVSSVVTSGPGITAGSGDLGVGSVVTLTVNLIEAVTVVGGVPTLTLNDGGTASYTGGSGTNALTFSYTVGAGQNTADLAVTAFNQGTATIINSAGNAANLTGAVTNPAGILQIDTTTPTVSSVVASGTGITAGTGDLAAGSVVTLTLNLSGAVTVAGGIPTLTLNDGGTATYTGGSGTNALTFSYTVGVGQNTADLTVTAINQGTATITNSVGNAANLSGAVTNPAGILQIDTTTPSVSSVVASGTGITAGAGDLGVGKVVTLTLNLSEAVTVAGGVPTLTLNDGGTATYTGGSGTALTFSYTVGAGQNTADLTVTAINPGTATIKNGAGTAADLSGAVTNPAGILQIDTTTPSVSSVVASGTGITAGAGDLGVGSLVTLTVNLNEAVTVAGGVPTLTLNDGGTASYTGGSGTNALTFKYTVAAGQNTADLAVTAFNAGTATIKNGAGTAANLSGAVTNPAGTLQIDTTTPSVSSVVTSGTGITAGSGDLGVGSVVTLTLNLNEAVTVAGGVPTLTLNDGGTATYVSGSGTNALTFSYTVGAGQNTADLAVTGINPGTATIKNAAGTAANLAAAVTNPAGVLQIDTLTPSVSSVVASGTGITAGAGDLGVGKVVTLTLNLSEAVTVAGGVPTLTLNDGGIATYTGGSGTNALTFSYTVGAGQNTADLAVTAVNSNSATFTNGAGTAANLAGVVTNPAGILQIDTTTPTLSSITETPASGHLKAGKTVTLTLNMSEAVTVAGGTPTLTLNDGATATYAGGSGTSALTFSYTVAAGQNAASLAATTVNLNGATITNGAGTAASFTTLSGLAQVGAQIDTTIPTVTQVVALPVNGTENPGALITLTVDLSKAVTVAGTPTLTLNDGGIATYVSGSGTNALTFNYVVAATDSTVPTLAITQVNLASGATVLDAAGNIADLSGAVTTFPGLSVDPPPVLVSISESPSTGDLNAGTVTLTLHLNDVVTVAGGIPTLTLNDGGTATYTGGTGTNALTFSYTVGVGQNTASLAATAVNFNGATVQDSLGNAAVLLPNSVTQTGPQIDTNTPSVSSVVASGIGITGGTGDLPAGSIVTLTVNLSEAVTVAGGTPTLTLNDGGTATYAGGSSSNALTFSYTVGAGQNTADLAVTAVNLGTATVKNGAGTAANLSGAITNPAGTLQIDTSTHIAQVGSNYFLDNINGSGPELKFGGAAVTVGEFSGWTAIGAVQTSSGYDVAWKNAASNQYAVWTTDSSGNFVSSTGAIAGTSGTLETYETTFNQDLNGDGVIGIPTRIIQTDGSTSLVEVGNNYFLNAVGGSSGPELKFGGAAVVAGQFGTWTALGAVQTSSGYDVAWKDPTTNQYAVWATDHSGNFVSSTGAIAATSLALETYETTLNQDLNGDGVTGVTTRVIQTDGSTSLVEVANNYFLDPLGGSSGPELKFGGPAVAAGQFGGWTALGAVQTASGYDVAWKDPTTNQYAVWTTDSSGNFVSSTGAIAGTSTTLETFEITFNQDLNGDGVIGIPTIVIQTDGSTSLVQVGSNYFLDPVGGSSGPELKFGGAAVTVGEFSGWTAIGAELTSTGYGVAWKDVATNQYAVWTTDSNGNFVSSTGAIAATSTTLEMFENTFQQDLNGDGVIGIYASPGTTLQISTPLAGPSGSATIGTGATLELVAADSASVTFSSPTGMLVLDKPSTFNGVVFNFSGNGTLSGSDQIDLKGINFNSVQDSYSNGVLSVTDGTNNVALDFNGNYTLANFKFASDGHGGTIVYDPPAPTGQGGNVPAVIMHDPGVSAVDQQLALLSQHMASAFPSSAFGNSGAPIVGPSELGGGLSPLAQPIANQQHA